MKPIIKASLVAAAISFLSFGAQAAGLGQITVLSKLGQPLDVEIQINATPQELQSLTARVAPPDAFAQGGIPYASFVPNVRVAVENRGDRSVLKLSSNVQVNETIASLIIQLNWDDGRVARTYNILLDPPDLAISPPPPVEPTVVVQPAPLPPESPPASVPAPAPSLASTPAPAPAPYRDLGEEPTLLYSGPTPEQAPAPETAPETAPEPVPYRDLGDDPTIVYSTPEPEPEPVREEAAPAPEPRESLTVERGTITPSPMPLPAPTYYSEALDGGDYTVKSGDTLGAIAGRRAPTDVSLDQMMMALYRANPTAFINNNINRLKTGAILKMPSGDDVRSTSHTEARREVSVHAREFNAWRAQLAAEVANRPATPVEDSAGSTRSIDTIPPPAEQNIDKVVIASGDGSGDDVATRLQNTEADLASTQEALKHASERVKALEDIAKLEEQRAEVAKQAAELRDQAAQASAPTPSEPPQTTPAVETATAPPEPPAAPVVETPPTPEPTVVEPVVTEPESAQSSEPSSSPLSVDASQELEGEDPLLERIPTLLGIGALIVMILGAYFGIRSWRQNKRSDIGLDTLSQEATSMFPSEATSIFGDNGGQNVDTTGSSVIHTDFSQTGLSIDTNEGVDPVAEADVYMAYGRDSQAEEILNDALKADPKRGAIYVKLLEIYAQRQDLMLFETTASELFSRTEGQGRDWEKAAQMGRRLDPSNPLYSGRSPEQKDGDFSRLPGLEPAIEEPSRLDMGAPSSVAPPVSSGPALSDLDFGASPSPNAFAATGTGQLKDTVAAHGSVEDLLSEQQMTTEAVPDAQRQARQPKKAAEPTTEVDFQFEPAEDGTPKPPGSIDFDLGKSKQASETGKQPISVTVSRPSSNAKGTASKQPVGVSSRKADSRTASPRATNDLAGPLDFDMPAQDPDAFRDMGATVVLPSALGGDEHSDDVTMDLEKTGFDPNALDFDLDLDLKSDAAAVSISPKTKGRQSSIPANAVDAGEIDIKLDLAKAYGDMGDTEGALELLREVVEQGNATQKAEAKALIASLG